MAVIRTSHIDLHVNGNGAYAYVAQPDDDQQHPGIVLIQEWWGIEPHVQGLAQKLATDGFIVAVPDLYHGKIATEPNDAMRMMMMVRNNVDTAVNKIIGALDTLKSYPNVQPKKLGLIGFCMGGFLAYTTASRYPDLGAVLPFYGAGYDPTPAEVAKVNAPVYAFYGSQDDSVPAEQRAKIERLYKEAGKDYHVKVYKAGHAFINPDHGMGNKAAADDAWAIAVSFLKEHLR
jgi:carboxymethylenebutenolidase